MSGEELPSDTRSILIPENRPVKPCWLFALILLVMLGTGFRIDQFLARRAFGVDECSLLLNIRAKTARQLLGPLDGVQAAPPLALEVLRAEYVLSGDSELSLRAWSLGCAIAALGAFAALSWRILPAPAAFAVTGLFAFSDRLVWHAVEAKQYSGDILVSIVMLWMALGTSWKPVTRLAVAALAAAVMIWLSHPVLFTFAGISLAMLPQMIRDRRQAIIYFLCNAMFSASALALNILSIRIQKTDRLTQLWDKWFFPWSHPLTVPGWFFRQWVSLSDYPLQGFGGGYLLALMTLGIWQLLRRRKDYPVIILAGPILFVVVFAAARMYPFGGSRMTIFLSPMLFLLAGIPIGACYQSRISVLRPLWWMTTALVLGWIGVEAVYHVVKPEMPGPLRPAIAYLKTHRQSGDGIYVVGRDSASIFGWYWQDQSEPIVYKTPWYGRNAEIPFNHFWVIGIYSPKHENASMAADLQWAGRGARETDRLIGDKSVAVRFQRE